MQAVRAARADRHGAQRRDPNLRLNIGLFPNYHQKYGRAETGGPEQKTIIFRTRDNHATNVAIEMNNLYARWRQDQGLALAQNYAFKCTAASGGNDFLPDFRGSNPTIS